MNDWLARLIILIALSPFIMYFFALSKNIGRAEKKHNRDLTDELNPFTGSRMPVDDYPDKLEQSNQSEQ